MSEFDRFLPHLKRINHGYPNFDLGIRLLDPVANAHFPGNSGNAATKGSGPADGNDCANTNGSSKTGAMHGPMSGTFRVGAITNSATFISIVISAVRLTAHPCEAQLDPSIFALAIGGST